MAGAFQASAFQGSAFQTDESLVDTQEHLAGGAFLLPSDFIVPRRKKDEAPDIAPEPIPPVFGAGRCFARRPLASGRATTGPVGQGRVSLSRASRVPSGRAHHFDSVAADNAVIMLGF